MPKRQLLGALTQQQNIRAMLGLACLFTWYQIEIEALFPSSAGLACSPLFVACIASWVIVAAFSRRAQTSTLHSSRRLIGISLAAMALATIVTYLLISGYVQSLVLIYLCAVAMGVAFSFGFLAWAVVLAELDKGLLLGVALFSLVVVGLLDLLLGFLDHGLISLISMVLYGGFALILTMNRSVSDKGRTANSEDEWALAHEHTSEAEQAREAIARTEDIVETEDASATKDETIVSLGMKTIKPYRRFSIAYLLYSFVFGITFGVSAYANAGTIGSEFNSFALWLLIGALALSLAWVLLEHRSFGLKTIGFIISPLLVMFYILYLVFSGEGLQLVVHLTFALWWVTELFIFLTIIVIVDKISLPKRLGVFALFWACFNTAFALGILFGQSATFFIGGEALTPIMITGFSVIIVMLATSLQIGARTPLDKAPQGKNASAEQNEEDEILDPLELTCAHIASKSKLTGREEEVLVLLAQGHTRNGIAKKLVVSDNTVRAHVKSIYSKLHIHTKQELVDMIDKQRNNQVGEH